MKSILIKIGTECLPKDEILYLMPEFSAPANYKDAEKIQTWKARKQEEWFLDAPNSALSGKVLAFAYKPDGEDCKVVSDDSEAELLKKFWDFYRTNGDSQFVCYDARNFDIPFLVRRSWKNKVVVPNILNGKFLNWKFVDLAQVWNCGSVERVSLGTLAKFFGIENSLSDKTSFPALWKVNPESAKKYLCDSLELTQAIGETMCVLEGGLF